MEQRGLAIIYIGQSFVSKLVFYTYNLKCESKGDARGLPVSPGRNLYIGDPMVSFYFKLESDK